MAVASAMDTLDSLETRDPADGGTAKYVSAYERTSLISMRARHLEIGGYYGTRETEVLGQTALETAEAEYMSGALDSKFYIVRPDARTGKPYKVLLSKLKDPMRP